MINSAWVPANKSLNLQEFSGQWVSQRYQENCQSPADEIKIKDITKRILFDWHRLQILRTFVMIADTQ